MWIWLFAKAGKSCNARTNVAGAMELARFKESIADSSVVTIN
jgi:hypothetical protein